MVAVCLLVGVLLGYAASGLLPKRYTAEAQLHLAATGPFDAASSDPAGDASRYVGSQADLLQTTAILQQASRRLGNTVTPIDLLQTMQVESAPTSDVIRVRSEQSSAEDAARSANAIVDAYRQHVRDQVAAQVAAAQDELPGNQSELNEVRLRAAVYGDGVAVAEPAGVPLVPSSPRPVQNAALLGLLFGLAALAWAFLRDSRQSTRLTVGDIDTWLGAPLVGRVDIPAGARGQTADLVRDANAVDAGGTRTLLVSLDYALENRNDQSVLITSPRRTEATTFLALQLAAAAAVDGRSTVLVDGDPVGRQLTDRAAVESGAGLEKLADGEVPVAAAVRMLTLGPGLALRVVPQPRNSRRWTSARAAAVGTALRRLQWEFGLTLLDSPPLLESADTLALAGQVDGVLLVLDETTSAEDLEEVARRLGVVRVPLLGYVLSRRQQRFPWSRRSTGGAKRRYRFDQSQLMVPPPQRADSYVDLPVQTRASDGQRASTRSGS